MELLNFIIIILVKQLIFKKLVLFF